MPRAAAKAKTARRARIDPKVLRDRLTPLVQIVAAVLVVVAFGLVGERIAAAARAHPRFVVDPAQLVQENLPHWMPEEVVTDVRAHLRRVAPRSTFADEFESTLRDDLLAASWWIEDVRRVERLFPNRVRVDLAMRKPVATCERGEWSYLLDGDGRVLYREPVDEPSAFGFAPRLQIRGATADAALDLGDIAADPQVVAGARVAAEVLEVSTSERRILPQVQIVAVDVAHPTTGLGSMPGVVHLVTDRGVLVRWGRPRKDPKGTTELPVDRKVRMLERVERLYPGLTGFDEVRVDIAKLGDVSGQGDPMVRIGQVWVRCDDSRASAPVPSDS